MPEIIMIVVTISTIFLIVLFSLFFIKNSKKKTQNSEIDLTDFEDRVLELVSKFQHISATRLSSLENKISEMNKLLREANETYFKLSSMLSDATKIMTEIEKKNNLKNLRNSNIIDQKNEISDGFSEKDSEEIKIDYTEAYTPEKSKRTPPYKKNDDSFSGSDDREIPKVNLISEKKEADIEINKIEKPFDLKTSSLEHKILNLSSEGLDSAAIAKELEVGKGEVDLVLGLFKRKFS
jgi:hypothetical protein